METQLSLFDVEPRALPGTSYKAVVTTAYAEDAYPSYTNFDGIGVANVADIPGDWPGNIGVPITFLEQHNPDQFEIVGLGEGNLA